MQQNAYAQTAAAPASFDNLDGCLVMLMEAVVTARNLSDSADKIATSLAGLVPPACEKGMQVKAVASGYVDRFADAVRDLAGILNQIHASHIRAARAISND